MKCRNVPIIKSVRFPVGWMFLKFCPLFSDWLRCEWNEWNKTRPRQFHWFRKYFYSEGFENVWPRYFFNFGHPKIEYKNLIGISKNRWLRLIRPYKRACWWFIKPLITLYLNIEGGLSSDRSTAGWRQPAKTSRSWIQTRREAAWTVVPTVVTVTCSQDFNGILWGLVRSYGHPHFRMESQEATYPHWFDPRRFRMIIPKADLVGGLEHSVFFHILGTIIRTDYFFQRGRNHQPEIDN